jgi:uncharacterized protein
MSCEFEVFQGSDKGYRWRFKAANGEVVASSSESYKTKASCLNGIRVVQEGSPTATIDDHTVKGVSRSKKAETSPKT